MARDSIRILALWILGSLLAIAIIGDYPYLGIAAAILSGIALGITHLFSFDKTERKASPEQPEKDEGAKERLRRIKE